MKVYVYERDHLTALRQQNAGCTLFLRRNGDFPLSAPCPVALYGSGARRTVKGGTGSGEVNSRFFVTAEQGLTDAGFTVTTGAWLDGYDAVYDKARRAFLRKLRQKALKHPATAMAEAMGAVMPEPAYQLPLNGAGDTAIYVLGRISGEGSDRAPVSGDILLTQTERRDILELNRRYKRFLLVLNTGGPVDLSPLAAVENILLLGQLGVETGALLADILLGRSFPSGKLATTWSAWEDYCHIGDECDWDDTRYREGIYVGYRYFDSVGRRALFPFGFGLGYTDFSVNAGAVGLENGEVTVCASVTNTGRYPGREVVQVYVSSPAGKLDKPYQALAGFAKTKELRPGETASVAIRFPLADLASYDESGARWVLEAGDYIVRVGNSSVDTAVAAALRLEREVVTLAVKNTCGKPDFEDWKPDTLRMSEIPAGTPVVPVPPESIPTAAAAYDREYPIDEFIRGLSDEELCTVNIGRFDPKGGVASIIGSAGNTVAGAAGETTDTLKDKGFPVLVMADGPAGLRLSKIFYRDEKGAHSVGTSAIPETILELLPAPTQQLLKRKPRLPKGAVLRPQYATAIPIGMSIAQSWDLDYARMCGDIVGDEMVRFGVHLWLAPALNIHRSIRCGRNFEYFSEDPLLSGLFAAALTNGVQSHPGCGVTIKHYCANNQETNRYNNNSLVSERAMREIYLKGFGICVRESQPAAVMTSYNLLNGVHTSQRRDTIEDVLRCEFGFQGIVMTDWVIPGFLSKDAKYAPPDAGHVAAAGGDLYMPGSGADLAACRALLESGGLSRRQLEINATRVYRLSRKLNGQALPETGE